MRRATLVAPPRFRIDQRGPDRVVLTSDTGAIACIFVPEMDVMRLLLLAGGVVSSPPSWAIAPGREDIAEPGRDRLSMMDFTCPSFDLLEEDERVVVSTPRLRVTVALTGLCCHWEQRVGNGWRTMQRDRPTQAYDFGWWDGRAHHYVARAPGERFYGLGEKTGALDRAGRRFRMAALDPMGYDPEHTDPLYKSIPYLLVAQRDGPCHGCFYDSVAAATVDLGAELDNYHGPYRHFVADHGDLDLWMIAGPTPAAVTERFTWLTGRPAATPCWALSYSGSTMSYTDAADAQVRMEEFLTAIAAHGIPCRSFHLSSGYTSIGKRRYVFNWNRDKFPNPAAFAARFEDNGVHLVANIKPALLQDHPLFAQAAAAGLFVRDRDGAPSLCQFWDEIGAYIDFTNPDAAAWWRARVTDSLLAQGIAATWNDNNEYEIRDRSARFAGFGRPMAAVAALPIQPLLMARASRQAQVEHRPTEIPYVVTRAGGTGLHRYAQTWTGDNRTSWASLKWNIRTGLGLALSGVSNFGHDVGGFAGAAPGPELLVRWIQAGLLLPRFSIHSWNDDGTANEPWMYPEVLGTVQRLMRLRERLLPAIGRLLEEYRNGYAPVLRPLWYDFPDDPECWNDTDAFLVGASLLVVPVTAPGQAHVKTRLPSGSEWVDLASGRCLVGGVPVTLAAPIDGPPTVLLRTPADWVAGKVREAFGTWCD